MSTASVTATDRLDRRARTIALTLMIGGIMAVLDVTITNVAIGRLSQSMDASLSTIQWVATGYTLALATVIPVASWAIARFGARRTYLAALGTFVAGSLLTGLAWNVESLIAFRVLQGLGGGLLNPVSMTIVLRAAHPSQRGRIMSILGIPILIAPVLGPTVGGWLVDEASWRWIFFLNVPLGIVALLLAGRVLDRDDGTERPALDLPGLLMLSPGLAAVVYGLSRAGEHGTVAASDVVVPVAAGAALVAAFVRRALSRPSPLLELRILRLRPMASGVSTMALFAAAYFGSMFLVPLYYQVVRGESAAASGALGIPQAIATGVALQVASRLVDRVSPGRVVGVGIALATIGYASFAAAVGAETPYWVLILALTVGGLGVGGTMMPTMTTATRHLDSADLPAGTTLLNIGSQVAVSFGTAAASVLLGTALESRVPGAIRTGVGDVYGLGADARRAIAAPMADAFQSTLTLTVALMVAAFAVATLFLPRGKPS